MSCVFLCSTVRAFSIRNISTQPLVLRLACTSGHGSVTIYRQSTELRGAACSSAERRALTIRGAKVVVSRHIPSRESRRPNHSVGSSSRGGGQPSAPRTLLRTEPSVLGGCCVPADPIDDGAADSANAATSKGSRREQLLQRFEACRRHRFDVARGSATSHPTFRHRSASSSTCHTTRDRSRYAAPGS